MSGNGTPDVPQTAAIFQIQVEWQPATGQLRFATSEMDDVVKLGMLDMAKALIIEGRLKAQMGIGPQLVVPGRMGSRA